MTRPTTNRGDWWDHVALDPESRLVLAVVPGARDAEAVEEVVGEVKEPDRGPGARPGDQRRLPGVRDGAA